MRRVSFFFLILSMLLSIAGWAQKPRISFRDSLDHKLDLSEWVLKANGFIPLGNIITEPALGGFGISAFAIWVNPNKPYIDTLQGKVVETRVKPNLFAVGGAYTVNNSWGVYVLSLGAIKEWRSNYRLMGGILDMNLNFYRDTQLQGEESFLFNVQMIPISGQLIKQFGTTHWFAGLYYSWQKFTLQRSNPDFYQAGEDQSYVSRPGLVVEYDSRDNVFTPDRGLRWNTLLTTSAPWLGSDFSYSSLNTALFWYLPVSPRLISGYRLEFQYLRGDAPFYLLPYVDMRGIAALRYQGNRIGLAETEWRWDFTYRFSGIAFGGAGKAVEPENSWSKTSWHPSGGLGFRYLVARQLKLRGGVDVAVSSEQWAYYIVLGTNWIR